mgnify:CR=1 FL=1
MSKDKPADIPTRQSTGANCAPAFVYTIFMRATVEPVWKGLIDRHLTKSYWVHFNQSVCQAVSRCKLARKPAAPTNNPANVRFMRFCCLGVRSSRSTFDASPV